MKYTLSLICTEGESKYDCDMFELTDNYIKLFRKQPKKSSLEVVDKVELFKILTFNNVYVVEIEVNEVNNEPIEPRV
jgi:hypothetical protein